MPHTRSRSVRTSLTSNSKATATVGLWDQTWPFWHEIRPNRPNLGENGQTCTNTGRISTNTWSKASERGCHLAEFGQSLAGDVQILLSWAQSLVN